MSTTKTILIAGATGAMGRKIARELIARGSKPRLMVRGGEYHRNFEDLRPLVEQGATVVDADVGDPASLPAAVEGVDVVISVLQGGPDVIIDGQRALAEAAKSAGAKRIFPSDFSVDFRPLAVEEHLFLGWRKQADEAIAAVGLAQTNTLNGAFTDMLTVDFFNPIKWDEGVVESWIDPNQRFDFTTMDDTAAYVAEAALDDEVADGGFAIVGDSVSMRELADIAARIAGKPFTVRDRGDLAALDAEIDRLQRAHPHDPMAWAGLQYTRAMASGRGKIAAPMNERYPGIVPETVEKFLRKVRG